MENVDENLDTIFSRTTRLNENVFLMKTIWDEKSNDSQMVKVT